MRKLASGVWILAAVVLALRVISGCGGAAAIASRSVPPAGAPVTVSSISPSSGLVSGGTSVVITGSNFKSGAAVMLGGAAAGSVSVVSATQIQAVTPAHAAGQVDVVVTNPDGQLGALTAAFSFQSDVSTFPYVMGDTFFPLLSPPSQPAKGASYTDPRFHTTITRVTNTVVDTAGAYWGATASYSTWSPLSSDGKYLILRLLTDPFGSPGHGLYNADTFAYIRFLDTAIGWNGQDGEPRWDRSGNHPTWIYYRKNMTMRRYDVSDQTDGLVHDFAVDFPAYATGHFIYSGEKSAPSLDGRYWAYMVQQEAPPYNVRLMFVYDMVANAVVSSLTFPAGRFVSGNPHEVMMSPSGNYVYAGWFWNGTGDAYDGPRVYPRGSLNTNVKAFSDIPHANFVYSKQGHEGVIGLHPSCDVVRFTRLDTGEHYDLYPQAELGITPQAVDHYWTSPSSSLKGWAFVSTGLSDNATWWDSNAIFAFEVDETKLTYVAAGQPDGVCPGAPTPRPRIWRIASTQNIETPTSNPRNYYQQANATMDYGGLKIWFGSNWNDGVNGRQEVYQVTLPPSWWQDLSGGGR